MYLDEAAVEAENRSHLSTDPQAELSVRYAGQCIERLKVLIDAGDWAQPDDVAYARLGIRVVNAAAAAGKLALAGYYQPATAMVRDIIEVAMLLDLFQKAPGKLTEWREADEKKRLKVFKPVLVREQLDRLRPQGKRYRDEYYKTLSAHGTHVDPQAVILISPEGQTVVGPFPDHDRIVALAFEIARQVGLATAVFVGGFPRNVVAASWPGGPIAFQKFRIDVATGFLAWQQEASKALPEAGSGAK